VPIFSTAQKAKISAGSILVKQKKLEETAVKQELEQKIQGATALYIQYKKRLIVIIKKACLALHNLCRRQHKNYLPVTLII